MITKKVDVSDRLIYEQIETVKHKEAKEKDASTKKKISANAIMDILPPQNPGCLHAAVISFDLENNDRCM